MTVPFFDGRFTAPVEVVENIAFALLASAPLESLAIVLPLLETSKAFFYALSPSSGTTLYSRLCRLKFDVDAFERRNASMTNKDLTDHLLHMHATLRSIRRGDVFDGDVDNILLNALSMMLHDEGKNRIQLEKAGIVPFVDRFVRLRLHEAKESNDMWPIENTPNSAALWLSWLLTTKEQLENETEKQRADLIDLVLPFLLCPYRYPSAYAPSNHFILPLQREPHTSHTVHGQFPVYHTKNQSTAVIHFSQSSISLLIPPISAAAKLLFWSRRETKPFFNTSVQIARNRAELGGNAGLTLDDLVEFNSSKVAKLRPVVRWDWEQGEPVVFCDDGSREACAHELSKQWDADWWRIRMCQDIQKKQPRWRLGNVYRRGLLTGLWQGVYFLSNTGSLIEVLQTAECPDVASGLFELLPRPMLMRLQEHNFVRTPGLSYATSADGTSRSLQPYPIPVPQEVLMQAFPQAEEGDDDVLLPVDVSISNAWIPGPIGSLKWYEGNGINPSVKWDLYTPDTHHDAKEAMRSATFVVAPGLPSIVRADQLLRLVPPSEDSSPRSDVNSGFIYETYAAGRESVHERMGRAKDQSMFCCMKCAERDNFMKARKEYEQVEEIFTKIGMGKRRMTSFGEEEEEEEDDVFDLELNIDLGRDLHVHQKRRGVAVRGGQVVDSSGVSQGNRTSSGRATPDGHYGPVEFCDDGIEDTIVTGQPDERHRLAWGPSTYYGRVRPWDGMIAILKQHPSNTSSGNYGNFLFYGYIYGGDTFVGNWRFASADPFTPGFENPFIMSKKDEGLDSV